MTLFYKTQLKHKILLIVNYYFIFSVAQFNARKSFFLAPACSSLLIWFIDVTHIVLYYTILKRPPNIPFTIGVTVTHLNAMMRYEIVYTVYSDLSYYMRTKLKCGLCTTFSHGSASKRQRREMLCKEINGNYSNHVSAF